MRSTPAKILEDLVRAIGNCSAVYPRLLPLEVPRNSIHEGTLGEGALVLLLWSAPPSIILARRRGRTGARVEASAGDFDPNIGQRGIRVVSYAKSKNRRSAAAVCRPEEALGVHRVGEDPLRRRFVLYKVSGGTNASPTLKTMITLSVLSLSKVSQGTLSSERESPGKTLTRIE